MKKHVLSFSILVIGILTLSCQGEKRAQTLDLGSQTPGGPTNVSSVEGVENGSPLYFKLGIAWESDTTSNYTTVKTCYLAAGSVSGTHPTCTITVPELQLYYSKLNFKVGTLDTVNCPFVAFQPYYYLRSVNDIVNDWDPDGTTVTCSTEKFDPSCYGGAAPALMSDFGTNFGYYFQSSIGNEANYKLESSNQKRQLGFWPTNLMVTNDIADETAGSASGAGTKTWSQKVTAADAATARPGETYWQDYVVACKDIWGATTHSITITISDDNTENTSGGAVDHYYDWVY